MYEYAAGEVNLAVFMFAVVCCIHLGFVTFCKIICYCFNATGEESTFP